MIEKYLGANRSKEIKIKSLLKFFLPLEEDCNMEGLCIILEMHHFSLLSFWPFPKHKNSAVGEMKRGRGEAAFLKRLQVFCNQLLHDRVLFPEYKQKCLHVSLACYR